MITVSWINLIFLTAIVPLRLMALGVPHHWWDVWSLAPPDSIVVWLVGCQGSHFCEVAHNLIVRRRNDFHFVNPCTSHNDIVWRHIVDH